MNQLEHPELKHSVCVWENSPNKPKVKRYVVETLTDLKRFLKIFPNMDIRMFVEPLKQSIKEKKVILLTDPHHMTGCNTYCYEHPEMIVRVK